MAAWHELHPVRKRSIQTRGFVIYWRTGRWKESFEGHSIVGNEDRDQNKSVDCGDVHEYMRESCVNELCTVLHGAAHWATDAPVAL